ncbi:hypothetical protein CRE_10500 [Caenorhabditis remanei]|uniref:F-box domain-containing protein n=1 Tax=Caenorhabditis remanei TaxID=31234 RepID=E3N0X6_CAERE|nr:hypothetical protein CRE_10500 [Caenorhabditis remanei]
MTTPLPLLRLPRLVLISVFKHMEPVEVIAVSLLSKRANNLSKILRKISPRYIYLKVNSDHLDISFRFESWNGLGQSLSFYTENAPDLADVVVRNRAFTDGNIGLSASQWLERILDVTNCESPAKISVDGTPQFDVCDAFATLTKLPSLLIKESCDESFAKKALDIFSTIAPETTLFKIPYKNREEFQTFLKTNLNYLFIYSHCFWRFSLDDLLVTNALKVQLLGVMMTARDLNLFLISWFQSKHNSRLEHLTLRIFEMFNDWSLPEILNAVPFPRAQERMFYYSKPLDTPSKTFRGGYDIERSDGKKATITFEIKFNMMYTRAVRQQLFSATRQLGN